MVQVGFVRASTSTSGVGRLGIWVVSGVCKLGWVGRLRARVGSGVCEHRGRVERLRKWVGSGVCEHGWGRASANAGGVGRLQTRVESGSCKRRWVRVPANASGVGQAWAQAMLGARARCGRRCERVVRVVVCGVGPAGSMGVRGAPVRLRAHAGGYGGGSMIPRTTGMGWCQRECRC